MFLLVLKRLVRNILELVKQKDKTVMSSWLFAEVLKVSKLVLNRWIILGSGEFC